MYTEYICLKCSPDVFCLLGCIFLSQNLATLLRAHILTMAIITTQRNIATMQLSHQPSQREPHQVHCTVVQAESNTSSYLKYTFFTDETHLEIKCGPRPCSHCSSFVCKTWANILFFSFQRDLNIIIIGILQSGPCCY